MSTSAVPGQENHGATELSYNIFRWYRAGWRRYTQADPLGIAGGTNLFAYAVSNPLSYIDPSGLEALPIPPVPPPGEVCPFPSKPPVTNPSIGWRGGLIAILWKVLIDPGELNPASFEDRRPRPVCDPCNNKGKWKCRVRCQVINNTTGSVEGYIEADGYGNTEAEAFKAGQKYLQNSTPKGFRTRHCHKVGRCEKK